MSRFASVVLDADSTLAGIEGIDWLASLRSPEVAAGVARFTDQAMAGQVPLEEVYARRLALIAPTRSEVEALGAAYLSALAPGAADAVARLRRAGVTLRVVSGGVRQALLPLAEALGFQADHVHAVDVTFDVDGSYRGLVPSPLTTQHGKAEVVAGLGLPGPVLAVGDGATDLAMRPAVDAFAAFTGFVRRASVAQAADFEVEDFDAVVRVVVEES